MRLYKIHTPVLVFLTTVDHNRHKITRKGADIFFHYLYISPPYPYTQSHASSMTSVLNFIIHGRCFGAIFVGSV